MRTGRTFIMAATLLAGFAAGAQGQALTVEATAELRWFPESPQFADQRANAVWPSVTLEPELVREWDGGQTLFVFRPFGRLDAYDDGRTHLDIREALLTRFGSTWSVSAGFGRAFWGVTEVNHLIDIINQTDAVEDLDGEDKLGQPMVTATVQRDWGAVDLYWMPAFRERTFHDSRGRLRGPLPVHDDAVFTSGAGEWHQDVALRWSHILGAVDVGVSGFRGTSREPRLSPVPVGADTDPTAFRLQPIYDVIDQVSVDLQWTRDATLWKLEALTRGGHGDRFLAVAAGLEHTRYQLFGGASDLGLLAEVMVDGRDDSAPFTLFDNDVFGGFRWALNDAQDTSVLGGVVVDWETGALLGLVEAERRLRQDWTVELEARVLGNTDPGTVADALRRDSFLTLRVGRYW